MLVCEDKVSEVAITHVDRLMRFGQGNLEMLFACFEATLTVLEPGGKEETGTGVDGGHAYPFRLLV